MRYELLTIGTGCFVAADQVLAIFAAGSAPMRRLREEARLDNRMMDATQGKKTRSIVVLKTNHVVLSPLQPETLANRFTGLASKKEKKNK